jgi:hypothetical protein
MVNLIPALLLLTVGADPTSVLVISKSCCPSGCRSC